MATRQRKKSALKPLILPLVAIAMGGYFVWHGFYGDNGILARKELDKRADALANEFKLAEHGRKDIERRVKLLRSGAIDRDMLDERARASLGYAHSHDVVILADRTHTAQVNWKPVQVRR